MKFSYTSPEGCAAERRYIVRWLFEEVFGFEISFRVRGDCQQSVELLGGNSSSQLLMPDVFFDHAQSNWLSPESLPAQPLGRVGEIVALYHDESFPESACDPNDVNERLSIDVFGSLFFLMSRYEEAVVCERDQHGRFPSSASVMGKAEILHRALGNEYIEFLWEAMKRLWPRLERRARDFRIIPSHDIDHPSAFWGQSLKSKVKFSMKRLCQARLDQWFLETVQNMSYPRLGYAQDPFDTVDWIMDQSEEHGINSTFFYIPEQTSVVHDPGMPLSHPQVESQWKHISERGHEIGVHPGYETYLNPEKLTEAAGEIRRQLETLQIDQKRLGARQHYLRWSTPETAIGMEEAGLDYDSSLGYADQPGFRCGICYEYPLYDLKERKVLSVRERPLIVMDCSVIDERYMNLGRSEEAFTMMSEFKNECRKYNGDFTILWHNQRFARHDERELYQAVLSC